jgi:tetratricopeptide (TPR) repeat protein
MLPAMPFDLSGRAIFLATPGSMEAERGWIRDEVAEFNQRSFRRTGAWFVVTGYEDVPGAVERPQSAINPLVEQADFMILLVGDHLGSPTTATPPFRTGIEEELSVAVRSLNIVDAPMRSIMMAFQSHPPSILRRPTRRLREVLEFKNAIEATKELMHVGSVDGEDALRRRTRMQLEEWSQPLGAKEPHDCPLLLAALDRSRSPRMSQPPEANADTLMNWAEQQAERGLNTVADSAYAKAVTSNDPDHLHRYARFLQRNGQMERALQLDRQALSQVAGGSTVEDAQLRAEILAHTALLKRKLGDPRSARRLLDEAVTIARPHAAEVGDTMGYVLDQLGIVAARLGDLDAAESAYREAQDLRQAAGDEVGSSQSLINLARVARDSGRAEEAVDLLEAAIQILDSRDESRVLANALAAMGDAIAASDPDRAADLLARSLSINDRLGIADGVSVASNGLARLALSNGDTSGALEHARRVLEVSTNTGNQEGAAIAYRLLGQVHLARDEPQLAADAFSNAIELAMAQHDSSREAEARLGLAKAMADLGRTAGADEQVTAGRAAAARVGDQRLIAAFDDLTSGRD